MEEVLLKYDYETANYVGPAYFGLFPIASYNKRALPKKAYDPVMYGEFEGHQYYIPQNYQLSLTNGMEIICSFHQKKKEYHIIQMDFIEWSMAVNKMYCSRRRKIL